MHELRAPLNKLLSKNKKWCWTKECDNAFDKIKKCLLSDLALALYDPRKELIVASDTSNYGMGAMLLHKFEDGVTQPIAHASRAYYLWREIIVKLRTCNSVYCEKIS